MEFGRKWIIEVVKVLNMGDENGNWDGFLYGVPNLLDESGEEGLLNCEEMNKEINVVVG